MCSKRGNGVRLRRNAWLGAVALALALIGQASILRSQEVTLTLPGGAGDLRPTLEGASLVLSLEREGDGTPQDLVAAARADYRRLLTALYAEGRYGGSVSILIDGREAAAIAPLEAPARIARIELRIDPGPVFTFGRADIAPLPRGVDLPGSFATGQVARSDAIRDAAIAGVESWRGEGHAKADIAAQSITAVHPQQRLDAQVRIDPGPQLTFGPLSVTGNTRMRAERVRAIAGLPTNKVFDPNELRLATQRLRRTGVFDSVTLIEAETYTPDLQLPIEAQVAERKRRRLGAGIEVSTVDGLTLSAFWLHRNLLGGAERLRIEGEVTGIGGRTGGLDYDALVRFDRPATLGPDNDFYALAEIQQRDEPDYFLRQAEIGAGFTRIVNEEFSAEAGVGILTAREETEFGERRYTILTAPLGATYDRRDDPLDATAGYYIDLDITPFVGLEDLGTGGRLFADARAYRSFGDSRRVTLAGRAQLGSVAGVDAFEAPVDFLFYSGGGGTVRGQPYNSLGQSLTRGSTTATRGGLSFAGLQLESRVSVTDRIGVVGFYDVGHIGTTSVPLEDGDWHAGAGLGVRYDTGIGPLRVDLAVPAGGVEPDEDWQLYIGIGQSF